jgi:predicted nucleotidyltransferase
MVVGPPVRAAGGVCGYIAARSLSVGHNAGVHPSVEAALPEIRALCRRTGVRRLDLFGSASGSGWTRPPNDVDVLVEFAPLPPERRFEAFFALKEGLELILGGPVDVVTATELENPYFRSRVLAQREPLYAA